MSEQRDARRRLPPVDRLVTELEPESFGLPRPVVVDAVRTVVEAARKRARRTKQVPGEAELVAACRDELRRRRGAKLRPVINATGVLLHTNLGRAPLSERAIEAVASIARSYSNLEYDTEHGRRGDRFAHVEPLIALATGAEAALVVNNNAAAVLLVCAALGAGHEVIISRGELIEIGGEFRIPDVLAASGAKLKEVGTTNRTHLRDYERALSDETALVLKVHPSNYRVVGFTSAPDANEIATLAHKRGVPIVYDVGSGLVLRPFADEPVVGDAIAQGADLVCFSGDKLLGGPQAGIVVGKTDLVAQLRSHPLLRAMRPDKMQLAALGATIESYLDGTATDLPLWQQADASVETLRRRASKLAKALRSLGYEVEITTGESVTGGGSLPGHTIESVLIRVAGRAKDLATTLLRADLPVVARTENGHLVLDLRTVRGDEDALVKAAFPSLT